MQPIHMLTIYSLEEIVRLTPFNLIIHTENTKTLHAVHDY
jgi:hypothetical protein